MRRFRDVGWLVFAGVASLLALLQMLGVPIAVREQKWLLALTAPLYVLGAYWLATGAWLRTEWGKRNLGEPPPEVRRLSTAWTKGSIAIAAVCVLACALALGGQWIATR